VPGCLTFWRRLHRPNRPNRPNRSREPQAGDFATRSTNRFRLGRHVDIPVPLASPRCPDGHQTNPQPAT